MPLAPVTLTGRWVRLEPLAENRENDLFASAQDPDIWRYMPVLTPQTIQDVHAWVQDALARQARAEVLPFAIIELESGNAIGSTRYLDISEKDRHVEIGWTWLGKRHWRTPVNTECKYLLLRHAFEDLNCIRVQLKTDQRNERSQRAIERLGAVREGVLRKAFIMPDGFQRSSVYYSILDEEWPKIRRNLENKLEIGYSKKADL